jgi:hypothetical protein
VCSASITSHNFANSLPLNGMFLTQLTSQITALNAACKCKCLPVKHTNMSNVVLPVHFILLQKILNYTRVYPKVSGLAA